MMEVRRGGMHDKIRLKSHYKFVATEGKTNRYHGTDIYVYLYGACCSPMTLALACPSEDWGHM